MKQVLSMEQVNANLSGNTNLHCYKVEYSHYNDEPYYHFKLREKALIVAFGKMVYYHELHGDNNYSKMPFTIEGREYVPLADKKEAEKLLIICGLKQPKKIKEVTPEQRLRELELAGLIPIYKMMLSVDLISADLETKYRKDYWGNDKAESYMALVVRHSKGSFSLPIDTICQDEENNDEVQNIFFNALNMPVTSKMKVA